MTKLIKEIQGVPGHIVDLRDPDYLPGAVELERKARARAAGEAFNAMEALKNDVAKKFKAKITTWKEGRGSDALERVTLTFPHDETNSGLKFATTLMFDSSSRRYALYMHPLGTGNLKKFALPPQKAKELEAIIRHEWQKATGVKLDLMDIFMVREGTSENSIIVKIGAPNAKVSTTKYVKGVKEILDTIKMKF